MPYSKAEICANCDREIGHLDQAYVYENNVVCLECYERLKGQSSYAPTPSAGTASQEADATIDTAVQPAQSWQIPAAVTRAGYAGFWCRFAAMLIDAIILSVGASIIGSIIGAFVRAAMPGTVEEALVLCKIIALAMGWLYFALMESSSTQGTLGKMALGIIVTDMNRGRVSLGRATGRHFAKFVSVLTLLIGYIMAGFTDKKQALHDMIADCLVLKKP